MGLRDYLLRDRDVDCIPKVGDRVQAQVRSGRYNNGDLGSVVYADETKVTISTSRGYFSIPLAVFSTDFRVMHR